MPTNQDYIPQKLADFALWMDNFSTLITAGPTTYGLIAGDATAIAAFNTSFQTAYAISNTPATRTSGAIANTTAARIISTSGVRPYAIRISQNASVDPADKVAVGVTVRSTTITPVPPPTTQPALSLNAAIFLSHQLRYFDVSTPAGKAKPFGAKALQLWRSVGVVAATDPAQCGYSADITKSPFTQAFEAGDRGKICTYFARWVTQSGPGGQAQFGPWSDALNVTVI